MPFTLESDSDTIFHESTFLLLQHTVGSLYLGQINYVVDQLFHSVDLVEYLSAHAVGIGKHAVLYALYIPSDAHKRGAQLMRSVLQKHFLIAVVFLYAGGHILKSAGQLSYLVMAVDRRRTVKFALSERSDPQLEACAGLK